MSLVRTQFYALRLIFNTSINFKSINNFIQYYSTLKFELSLRLRVSAVKKNYIPPDFKKNYRLKLTQHTSIIQFHIMLNHIRNIFFIMAHIY